METLVLGGIMVIGFGILFFLVLQNKKQPESQSMTMLNQNIHGMQERLDSVGKSLNERLDNAGRVFASVNKELGQIHEMSRNLQSVQNFLKSPKLRGNLGEQVLQDLLEQHFPQAAFEMQYKFKSGSIVDAAIKTENGIICIDSKFPLENFDRLIDAHSESEEKEARAAFIRDVRKHVRDIASKYILPEEGTVSYAIMYIPSEAVYYEMLRLEGELSNYANDQKVIAVSPNGFYHMLRVLYLSMQGKRIEEQAEQILKTMEAISKDANKFGESVNILNTHITNASSALDRVNTDYAKLSGKIEQIKMLK